MYLHLGRQIRFIYHVNLEFFLDYIRFNKFFLKVKLLLRGYLELFIRSRNDFCKSTRRRFISYFTLLEPISSGLASPNLRLRSIYHQLSSSQRNRLYNILLWISMMKPGVIIIGFYNIPQKISHYELSVKNPHRKLSIRSS